MVESPRQTHSHQRVAGARSQTQDWARKSWLKSRTRMKDLSKKGTCWHRKWLTWSKDSRTVEEDQSRRNRLNSEMFSIPLRMSSRALRSHLLPSR